MAEKDLYRGPDFSPEPEPTYGESYTVKDQTAGFNAVKAGKRQGGEGARAVDRAANVAATINPETDRATLDGLTRGLG